MTTETAPAIATGVTVGSTGQHARWTVSPWGAVTPWGQSDPVTFDWFVAADDRWHVPAAEPTVRQTRIEGSPVVETRVRVPDGDAVQRVWAVPDGLGTLVVEFENESPMPFAIAVAGPQVVTERPPADVPIQGIELPAGAIVLPVGHRSTVRVAVPFPGGRLRPEQLVRLPPPLAVVRGWTRIVEQASRLVLPDEALVAAVNAARCDLLLEGPIDRDVDPAGFALDVAELVRCGDSADAWLFETVAPVEGLLRAAGRRGADPVLIADAVAAVGAARLVAVNAGDQRAADDLDRARQRLVERSEAARSDDVLSSFADVRRADSVGRFVRSIERRLVDAGAVLPGGMPRSWLGSNFEVHGLPTSASTTLSFAVRWHGERPAVLWEQQGDAPVELSAPQIDPGWTTSERSGEMLWPAPEAERRSSLQITVDPEAGGSFV